MMSVAIVGAAGRMGKALVRCAQTFDDTTVVAAVEAAQCPELGNDAGAVAGIGNIGVPIRADTSSLAAADVIIDFSLHAAVVGHVSVAAELGKPTVIGTTGLDEDEAAAVRTVAQRIPIVWAPNMSLGVNLLFAAVKNAAAALGNGYDVEIDETHHIHKKDAPSGTALRLGEKVAEGRGMEFLANVVHVEGARDAGDVSNKILIRSHREGEVVGNHTVAFENKVERVEFTHCAYSRDALALGALHAARWVIGRQPGLYDMQAVLGF